MDLLRLSLYVWLACMPSLSNAQAGSISEQYLLSALNQERLDRHLGPVATDPALHQAALAHAQRMAQSRGISHQLPGEPELATRGGQAGARFNRITENVAEGATAVILHEAWMHSPGHRDNILDPTVDTVGIAVVESRGTLYAVQDFSHAVPALPLEQQEAAVGMLLDNLGLVLLPSPDARLSCAMETGFAGNDRPGFVVRYTTGDLAQLPSSLSKRLAMGREHHVAVGACTAAEPSPFTSYKLAVVLYPEARRRSL